MELLLDGAEFEPLRFVDGEPALPDRAEPVKMDTLDSVPLDVAVLGPRPPELGPLGAELIKLCPFDVDEGVMELGRPETGTLEAGPLWVGLLLIEPLELERLEARMLVVRVLGLGPTVIVIELG